MRESEVRNSEQTGWWASWGLNPGGKVWEGPLLAVLLDSGCRPCGWRSHDQGLLLAPLTGTSEGHTLSFLLSSALRSPSRWPLASWRSSACPGLMPPAVAEPHLPGPRYQALHRVGWGVQGVFWGLWEAGGYGAALARLLEAPSSSGLLGSLFQSFEKYCKGAGGGGPGGQGGGRAEHGPSSS